MKVVGIAVVRNEADVIGTNIRHHLEQGIDEMLVVDNDSTDATPRVLDMLAAVDSRVSWRSEGAPYAQVPMTNDAAAWAADRGASWVVAADADEFWRAPGGFRRFLEGVPKAVSAVSVDVVNFVQWRNAPAGPLGLLGMLFRPTSPIKRRVWDEAKNTSARYPQVARKFGRKVILRAGLEFNRGQHAPLDPAIEPERMDRLVCLHAWMRGRGDLNNKERYEWGAHFQVDTDVEQHWLENTWASPLHIGSGEQRVRLTFDTRLVRAVAPYVISAAAELRRAGRTVPL